MPLEVLGIRQLIVIFLGLIISVILISFIYRHEKNKSHGKETENGVKESKKNRKN